MQLLKEYFLESVNRLDCILTEVIMGNTGPMKHIYTLSPLKNCTSFPV